MPYAVGTAVTLTTPVLFVKLSLEHRHPGELVAMLVMGGPFVQKNVDVGAGNEVLGSSSTGRN